MLLSRAPYLTIDANPGEYLRDLKNGKIGFEELGFASVLDDAPISYATHQLAYLRSMVKDRQIWMAYGNEALAVFIKEYYLRTLLMAANENLWETLDMDGFYAEFCNMQTILREVFPNWIDSDYLYGLGKNMLNILKSVNITIPDAGSLKALLQDVAILGLPPMVSVILPTYNRGEKLFEVLPSILHQTYENFEVVLVDNGSMDDTQKVIEAFGDLKVKYIKLDDYAGRSAAVNVGIKNASYNYIAFADSEDVWEETKLEAQMRCLLRSPDAGFCYCACHSYADGGRRQIVPRRSPSQVRKEGYIYPALLRESLIRKSSLVVKKECVDTVGGFNEALNGLEDWEFALRLAKTYLSCFVEDVLFDTSEETDASNTMQDDGEAMKHFYEGFERDRELFGIAEVHSL